MRQMVFWLSKILALINSLDISVHNYGAITGSSPLPIRDWNARGMLFYLKRLFTTLTLSIFPPLYKVFIRPYLGYAKQASSPILPQDCQAFESVQKLAVKFGKGLRHVPCETALQLLRLFYLTCIYKIMHGLLSFACGGVFAAPTRFGLCGHTFKIHQSGVKTSAPTCGQCSSCPY